MKYKFIFLVLLFCKINLFSLEYNGEFIKFNLGAEYEYVLNILNKRGYDYEVTLDLHGTIDIAINNVYKNSFVVNYSFRFIQNQLESYTLDFVIRSIIIDPNFVSTKNFDQDIIFEYFIENNEEVQFFMDLFYSIVGYYNELFANNGIICTDERLAFKSFDYFNSLVDERVINLRMSFDYWEDDARTDFGMVSIFSFNTRLWMRHNIDRGK